MSDRVRMYDVASGASMVIGREQDVFDGEALRLLQKALPPWLTFELSLVHFADDTPSHPRVMLRDFRKNSGYISDHFDGATIAEAADKCREALGKGVV